MSMKSIRRKLWWWHQKNSTKSLFKINDNYRIFLRNHNAWNFNDKFIFVLDLKSQGLDFKVIRIGLFNWALCLGISKKTN